MLHLMAALNVIKNSLINIILYHWILFSVYLGGGGGGTGIRQIAKLVQIDFFITKYSYHINLRQKFRLFSFYRRACFGIAAQIFLEFIFWNLVDVSVREMIFFEKCFTFCYFESFRKFVNMQWFSNSLQHRGSL